MSEKGWQTKEFAEAWKSRAGERLQSMAAMTEAMFDEARLGPGKRILDLGTGSGDTAILAAAKVGPTGSVLATDASAAMVDVARQAAAEAGAKNVSFRVMDAAAVDVEPAAFDAAIARMVLMFVDRPKALAGIARALRPGARFAATVWGPLSANPYHAALIETAQAFGGWGDSPPEVARAFSVNDSSLWPRWFEGAGFTDVRVRPVASERRYANAEEALKQMTDGPIHREPIEKLPASVRAEAWKEVERRVRAANGVFPVQTLVVSGEIAAK